jgi:putative component of toxin-antitoxin plasmid stabilization module
MKPWEFNALVDSSGNVITRWYLAYEKKNKNRALRARADVYLRRLRIIDVPWPFPLYLPLGDGVGEIRFDLNKVEYRILGYFGPGSRQYLMLLGATHRTKRYVPEKAIERAKQLKKDFDGYTPTMEKYDV